MKIFRMFGRGVRDAFKSVSRNFSLSIASISCISITLLIVSLSLVCSFNVKSFTKSIEKDVSIVVFMNYGVTDDELRVFESQLNDMSNVSTVTYRSPEDQIKSMIKDDPKWEDIIDSIGDEKDQIFHSSYLVNVIDLEFISDTVVEIENLENVQNVSYGEKTIAQLTNAFDIVEKIAIIIVLVLVIVTIFLIVNTIKLTIFSRKREISIMRVVGASNLTIKFPFVIEGMIIGILGSILPIIATIYGYWFFYEKSNGVLGSQLIKLISPQPFVFLLSLIILVMGIIVGMLGSARAVRKYLKV